MKPQLKSISLLCVLFLSMTAGRLDAQFLSVMAGADSSTPGSKLTFVNGPVVSATSGFAQPLVYTIVTNFVLTNIIYSTTNLQFWSLSNSNANGAAVGAHVVCEILSVIGPSGGILSFWEQGWRTPTYSFPVGVSPVIGSNRFDVSDLAVGAGQPDGDPVGSIPLRRFTANMPGEYLVTFKLFDTSPNTPAGGPMHTPSDPITIKFVTGLDLALTRLVRNPTNSVETLTFKQSALTNVFVEATTDLAVGAWVAVAGPFISAPALNSTTTLSFTNPLIAARFYRLRAPMP